MNKKAGEVCSHTSDSHHTVYEHFPADILISNGVKLHSAGRLDCDTEGLLLFTNDGKFSNFLTRPENKIEKTYFVRLKNAVSETEQKKYTKLAEKGMVLPAEKKSPEQKSNGAKIDWKAVTITNECEITLTEGKFHEVKRIFRALGNEVVYLKRVNFAGIELDESLKTGGWRNLAQSEIKSLKNGVFS
ncbi:pseudouridine synthase [Treponema sp.]|uniref:pseudouridine synthase n=1 Tax=Treponema sp. TaxID=166 RepID=UPI00388DF575